MLLNGRRESHKSDFCEAENRGSYFMLALAKWGVRSGDSDAVLV